MQSQLDNDQSALTAHLSMFIQNVAIETVGVWKSLGPSAFSHTDNSVLFGMKNSSLRKSKGKKKAPVMFDSATRNY